jgi:hypothetical protein
MGVSALYACSLLVALGAGPDRVVPVGSAPPSPGGDLGAEDARYLDWLLDEFIFDPRRATYVRATVPAEPDSFSFRVGELVRSDVETRDGWLVRGTNGEPDRVYFADGESVPAGPIRDLDFETLCARRYDDRPATDLGAAQRRSERTRESDLVLAAWLHRRGYDGLAARALASAREGTDDPLDDLRQGLARRAGDAAVRAFASRSDAVAVAHAARLFALYPELAHDRYPQVVAVATEILRRQRTGIGSRESPKGPPPEFAGWDTPTRAAFLVRSLDEVEAPNANRFELMFVNGPGSDWRLVALEGLGDAAVPALIDAVERDRRLTRQRENMVFLGCCGKGERRPERVLPVREVALDVLRAILRVRDFDPTGPADDDEDDAEAALAKRLRRYWARYGRLAFPERMMAILTDPAARPAARREAADSLVEAFPGSASSWGRSEDRRRDQMVRPSPVVSQYARPSVAEAILAAMDRERVVVAKSERPDRWEQFETEYLRILTDLGDVRVASELARRSAAETGVGSRLGYARAAYALGITGPLATLTRQVTTGAVALSPPTDRGTTTKAAQLALRDLVHDLINCRMPEADEALYALADPGHPYFPLVARAILVDEEDRYARSIWYRHPFCLTVFRHGLSDRRPTDGHSYRRGTEVEDRGPGRPRWWTPLGGADPERWAEHVEHTAADDVAFRLDDLVVGLPDYHPLRRDADQLLAETQAMLARYARRFRPVVWVEQSRWSVGRYGDIAYVPDIRPLGRPASAADVAAGRAVFELNGAGKVADVKLPAWLVLKEDAKVPDPPAGVIVQAEVGPDGTVTYGVIFRHAIRAVKAAEVGRLEPYER